MGKRGVKRKTRWRTLNIGTPPGEEDEEPSGTCNGYIKSGHEHGKERNGYGSGSAWLKSRHGSGGSSGSNGQSSGTSGYGSGGYRAARQESGKLSDQQNDKVTFNEDEYTRITAPRLDVLFKKSYLQNKSWTNMNSMSATPSTTGSQSASHSTADGSEGAEDQQLLDSMTTGKFEVSYGTYYDHNNGYYYDYPMMLVAPEMPDQMGSNIITAIPCTPVPLRPIEWVNPVFVPKLASQQYCYVDHQVSSGRDCAALVDGQGVPLGAMEPSTEANGVLASEILADEPEDAEKEVGKEPGEEEEALDPTLKSIDEMNGLEYAEMPYIETLPPQPLHVAHIIPQPMGQPYLYPGQYMFGPPMANVNGVMIQNGSVLRCSDVVTNSTAAAVCANRRRKKKKRKPKGSYAFGKTEDEEEDYTSEDENGLSSPCVSWSAAATTTTNLSNRPLNPECQEFHPRSTESQLRTEDCISRASKASMLNNHVNNEPKRLIKEKRRDNGFVPKVNGTTNYEKTATADKCQFQQPLNSVELPKSQRSLQTLDGGDPSESKPLFNGDAHLGNSRSTPLLPEINETTSPINAEGQRLPTSYESLVTRSTDNPNSDGASLSRRKYGTKEAKYVRESTTASDLDVSSSPKNDDYRLEDVQAMLSATTIVEMQSNHKDDLDICQTWVNENSNTFESLTDENNEMTKSKMMGSITTTTAATVISVSQENSGFDSQTKIDSSVRPISSAVYEWLKTTNSSDLFVTSLSESDDNLDEEEEEEEEDVDDDTSMNNEPPKNLKSNPIPALSVNGCAGEREASLNKFANTNSRSKNSGENTAKVLNNAAFKRNKRAKRAKRKRANSSKTKMDAHNFCANNQQDSLALVQENAQVSVDSLESPPTMAADGICKLIEKDSDVGMRIAENSRITMRKLEEAGGRCSSIERRDGKVHRVQEISCKDKYLADGQPVKTFERGEIVVSMEGELLLVALAPQEVSPNDPCRKNDLNGSTRMRRDSDCTPRDEKELSIGSIGSIEEPDVLECWETEIVEPTPTPKKALLEESANDELLVANNGCPDRMEHVQRYYRLQVERSETSAEDDICDNVALNDNPRASQSLTVPNTSDQLSLSTSSEEEIPMIVLGEKKENSANKNSKLPIEEAFEVYESFYTGKPLIFASMDSKLGKSRLFSRETEGPIPCKAVCCIIQ
ncbi:PREDICTED: uncharacterized protein LOC105368052 [Ceratosolen solmsi marchali]|uniref:Uncharacterized protein LOC105368052 n=1 Tax=Ceratosolen solmsi marchali TaxID=326594 RepID=A0AAJ6YVL7_9HYME|nr:PREDICTED: uncharacterized protein LOC105368052 [Ceratosolen solmsi marchali]